MPSTAEEMQQETIRQRANSSSRASPGGNSRGQVGRTPNSASRKVRTPRPRNNNLIRYTKVYGSDDDDDEEAPATPTRESQGSSNTTSYNPDELPYPEEVEELTSNGNSLPNITHRRKVSWSEKCSDCLAIFCSYDRFLCFLLSFIFLFAVFIAGIEYEEHHEPPKPHGGGTASGDINGSPRPPVIPNNPRPEDYTQRQIDLVVKMRELSGDVISTANTPHHKAAHWILWIDESGIAPESEFMLQRYVLALMYYQMGDGNHVFDLNPNSDECNWDKIGCNLEGHVQHIRFHNCDLSGNISEEIKALSELAYLDLSHNNLSGPIPVEAFKDLKKLQYVYLDNNNLEGAMPPSLCSLREKGMLLNLTSDCDIDEAKVQCTCCTNCGNTLPGLGPPVDAKDEDNNGNDKKEDAKETTNYTRDQKEILRKLSFLSGNDVIIDGNTVQHKATHWMIKEDKPMLAPTAKNLYQRYIVVLFWYMIDSRNGEDECFDIQPGVHECEWGSTRIICDENQVIEGLHLDGCNLSGSFPTEIRELPQLTSLNFRNNKLQGEIPDALRHLHQLMYLYLDHNNLVGSVSPFICEMHKDYDLMAFTTDCVNDSSKVDCDCCSNCRKKNGGNINKPSQNENSDNQIHLNERQMAVGKKLFDLSGAVVRDGVSPQHRAAHWIMQDDVFSLTAESKNLYQRYVIAVLYFMMGDQMAFSLDSRQHECKWNRIKCDDNANITYIKFDNLEIKGHIPSEIKVLSELGFLDLSSNNLQGSIPGELKTLAKLTRLFLEGNNLGGIVPNEMCDTKKVSVKMKVDCDKVTCSCCDGCESKYDESSLQVPNSSLTSNRRRNRIEAKSLTLLGTETTVKNSPQNLAMRWMIDYDHEQLDADSPHFSQRLVVALIFYSLGPLGWTDSFRQNPVDECSLHGVTCLSKMIVSLDLSSQSMRGTIPSGIQHLTKLTSIDFSHNNLRGEIPEGLASISELETLKLQYNKLVGTFPEGICSGGPVSFQVDCDAVSCSCCENCMVEDYPVQTSTRVTEIKEKLKEVSYQELDSESSPSSPRIKAQNWVINLDQMQLPASSETMVHRYILAVLYYSLGGEEWSASINNWLEGHMCQWSGVTCFMNREIVSLTMSEFGLRGQIPYELGQLNGLLTIDFSSNSISGHVPPELGDLEYLKTLNLLSNSMTGVVPPQVCKLRHESGDLEELDADCNTENQHHLACPINCCTSCSFS